MALSSFMAALALAGHASQAETARRTASTTGEVSVIPAKTPATMRIGNVDRCPALCALELALLP
jgi:hypothetical protein